jgi:hypothetical protein
MIILKRKLKMYKNTVFLIGLLWASSSAFAQQKDTLKHVEPLKATANIQVNNNGISLFPNLSLGKPATIWSLTVGKNHVFFEPELRWRLNGNPWSYILWLRYRPKRTEHFSWHMGAHPSYVIRETPFTVNERATKRWVAQRNVAAEVVPVWHYSPKFSIGFHMLASRGLDTAYGVQKSRYLSLQPRFPHIDISKQYYFGFFPQVFELTLDDKKGVYYSQMVSFNKKDLPFYLSSIFTYKIKSTIAGNSTLWNIALNYKL